MNKLRQSFRRKKDIYVPESSRPHQWQTDEEAVRSGKCSFAVKVTHTQTHLCTNHAQNQPCRKLQSRNDAWVDRKGSFQIQRKCGGCVQI